MADATLVQFIGLLVLFVVPCIGIVLFLIHEIRDMYSFSKAEWKAVGVPRTAMFVLLVCLNMLTIFYYQWKLRPRLLANRAEAASTNTEVV